MILGPDSLLAELARYAESGRPPTTRDTFVAALTEAEELRGADPRLGALGQQPSKAAPELTYLLLSRRLRVSMRRG